MMVPIWNKYHDLIREKSKTTPVFYLSYEQLVLNPIPVVKQLFCYLLNLESCDGTILEQRIEQVCGGNHQTHHVYKLKEGTGRLHRNVGLYSKEQLQFVATTCRENLHYLDYVKSDESPDPQQFFTYSSTTKELELQKNGYRVNNQNFFTDKCPKESWLLNAYPGINIKLPQQLWKLNTPASEYILPRW